MTEITQALKLFKDILEAGWHVVAILFVSTLVFGLFVPILPNPWVNMALWGAMQVGALTGLVQLSLRAHPIHANADSMVRWARIKQATWEVFELVGGLFAIAISAVCLHQVTLKPTYDRTDLLLFGGIGVFGVWMVVSAIRQYLRHIRQIAGGQGAAIVTGLVVLNVLVSSSILHATTVAPNRVVATRSPDGRFELRMEPSSDHGEDGRGIVSKVDEDGVRQVLWTVPWYDARAVLLDTGEHLIQGPAMPRDSLNLTDRAVTFHRRDELLRRYEVRDLLVDRSKIMRHPGGYGWTSEVAGVVPGLSRDGREFIVVTADPLVYRFDPTTGRILGRSSGQRLAPAGDSSLQDGEARASERESRAIREPDPALDPMLFRFSIAGLVSDQVFPSLHFQGEHQDYVLTPRQDLGFPAVARLALPTHGNKLLPLRLKPRHLLRALEEGGRTPFIARILGQVPQSMLVVKATGDRLHPDTDSIQQLREELGRRGLDRHKLGTWCRYAIDTPEAVILDLVHPLGSRDFYILDGLEAIDFLSSELQRVTGKKRGVGAASSGQVLLVDPEGRASMTLAHPTAGSRDPDHLSNQEAPDE